MVKEISKIEIRVDYNLSGRENMQKDLSLLEEFVPGKRQTIFRIFTFNPNCLTYGHAQKIGQIADLSSLKNDQWQVSQRPTGGGIVFHQSEDVSFSIVSDFDAFHSASKKPKEIFLHIGRCLAKAFTNHGFDMEMSAVGKKNGNDQLCFDYPAEFEIVHDGKKTVGYAQKSLKDKFLVQGVVFVNPLPIKAGQYLKTNISHNSFIPLKKIKPSLNSLMEISPILINAFDLMQQPENKL